MTLDSVGTTNFNVYASGDSRATDDRYSNPQLQSNVTNSSDRRRTITVEWLFGETIVANQTKTLDPSQSELFADSVSWETLSHIGLVPGDYPLRARIQGTDESTRYGTMHVFESNEPNNQAPSGEEETEASEGQYAGSGDTDYNPPEDNNDSNDDPTQDPSTSPLAVLPAVGPLSSTQTTIGAIVLVLVVLLR